MLVNNLAQASAENFCEEKELQKKYNACLHQINTYWFQRTRLRWKLEGDLNTAFFHVTTNARRRKNTIHMLQLQDGTWTIESSRIRMELVRHFKTIYCEADNSTPYWPDEVTLSLANTLPTLSNEQAIGLQAWPTEEEIRVAAFGLGLDRAAGPDGINARFVHNFWPSFKPIIEQVLLLHYFLM